MDRMVNFSVILKKQVIQSLFSEVSLADGQSLLRYATCHQPTLASQNHLYLLLDELWQMRYKIAYV